MMTVAARVLGVLLLAAACHAGGATAQTPHARVPPPGVVRAEIGVAFSGFDTRFGAVEAEGGGERQPLSAAFPSLLTSPAFAPIGTLQTALNTVYGALPGGTPGFVAGGDDLFLTTSRLRTTADHRRVPLTVEVGVLPRLSVRVRVPLTHQRLEVDGMTVGEGTLGINPDPLFNRELLGGIDEAYAALGGGAFLPVADSDAGRELQERVRAAAGGGELRLPAQPLAAIGVAGLAGEAFLRTGRYDPTQALWSVGDAELSVRVQLAELAGGASPESPPRTTFRSALEAGVRLPSGPTPTANYLVLPPPDEGLAGWVAALHNEVYAARGLGARATLRWEALRQTTIERRGWEDTGGFPPLPSTDSVRWSPGSIFTLDVAPGVLLADEITLFGRYGYSRRSGERYVPLDPGEGAAATSVRTAQRWGIGVMYSTPPTHYAARAGLPFEAEIVVGRTFSGSGGAPAARTVEMSARLFPRLWGRR